jgi:hypothetical protein
MIGAMLYVYGVVPPFALLTIIPLLDGTQLGLVKLLMLACNTAGSLIVMLVFILQALASVAVIT